MKIIQDFFSMNPGIGVIKFYGIQSGVFNFQVEFSELSLQLFMIQDLLISITEM